MIDAYIIEELEKEEERRKERESIRIEIPFNDINLPEDDNQKPPRLIKIDFMLNTQYFICIYRI